MKFYLVTASLLSLNLFAYIDPASGSAIISAIIGLFVALGMKFKSAWYKMRSFFRLNKKD